MYAICDPHDMFRAILDVVDEHGSTIVALAADVDRPLWTYTIGLVETFGHPEVGVVGESMELARGILDSIAWEVAEGRPVPLGKDVVIDGVVFHVNVVGPEVLGGGMFTCWHAYYEWLDDPPIPELSALEVIRCGNQRRNRVQRRASARGRHLRSVR